MNFFLVHQYPGLETVYSGDRIFSVNTSTQLEASFASSNEVHDSLLILGQTPSKVRTGFSIRKMFQGYLSELNIWDRELSVAEIKKMKSCEIFIKGNVIQWDREKLKIVGQNPNIGIENVDDMARFCDKKKFFVVPQDMDLKTAYKQCEAFGGQIAVPQNERENKMVLDLVKTFPICLKDNNNSVAWIGIEKKRKSSDFIYVDGDYRNKISNISIPFNIKKSVLDSLQPIENYCVTLKASGDWNLYRDCYAETNSIEVRNEREDHLFIYLPEVCQLLPILFNHSLCLIVSRSCFVEACNVCEFRNGVPTFTFKGTCQYQGLERATDSF